MTETVRRTYWHLEALGRKPTDYEIATSRLLYYGDRGFEVDLPIGAWYARHQRQSRFRAQDWEKFHDPRETTYARYVEMQKKKEIYVDGLFQSMEDTRYDEGLSGEWLGALSSLLPPLRFAIHGLQMAACYVGQMAPSGRIVVAALFQAADEMRRVQRLAYRTRALQEVRPSFGADARALWQSDPHWQPLRAAIERLLVTYDWGEAFTLLNVVLKPIVDDLVTIGLGRLAQARGDELLARVLLSLGEDCEWHRAWTGALVAEAVRQEPGNRNVLGAWVDEWRPVAQGAAEGLLPLLGGRTREQALETSDAFLASCGLRP